MIDKVSGSCIENLEPFDSTESIETEPPSDSIVLFTNPMRK
jgi:hypothetical protein